MEIRPRSEVMNSFRKKEGIVSKTCRRRVFELQAQPIPRFLKLSVRSIGNMVIGSIRIRLADSRPCPRMKNISFCDRHPAKFPDLYEKAGMEKPTSPVLQQLLEKTPVKYDSPVSRLRSGPLSKRILRKPANDCFARFDSRGHEQESRIHQVGRIGDFL